MQHTGIHVIETVYNGYKFRSRLEARWAVFFDALGVRYEYETQGFDLGDAGWYLPDFWLPDQQCWVEIKPGEPTPEECDKAEQLMRLSGKQCLLIAGTPWPDEYVIQVFVSDFPPDDAGGAERHTESEAIFEFRDCGRCDGIGLEGLQRYDPAAPVYVRSWICTCDADHWKGNRGRALSSKVNAAYNAARTARFEHGQQPNPRALRVKAAQVADASRPSAVPSPEEVEARECEMIPQILAAEDERIQVLNDPVACAAKCAELAHGYGYSQASALRMLRQDLLAMRARRFQLVIKPATKRATDLMTAFAHDPQLRDLVTECGITLQAFMRLRAAADHAAKQMAWPPADLDTDLNEWLARLDVLASAKTKLAAKRNAETER